MKNVILMIVVLTFSLINCSSPSKNVHSVNLDTLMVQFHEDWLKLNPLKATRAGDNRYNHLFRNIITEQYKKEVFDFYSEYKEALLNITRNNLTKEDQMNYDLLLWECNIGIEGTKHNDHLMPVNQDMGSLHLYFGMLASGNSFQPFRTVKDYDNWLSRLDGYLAWCDSAIVNMKKGIESGYTIPQSLVIKMIPQFDALDISEVEEHLYYTPIKNFPNDLSDNDKVRLKKAYKSIIENEVIAKHKRIKEFLKNEYLPACRTSSGINALPDGKEYYNYLIKRYTTTNMTTDEIFALGQTEVERITSEMELVKDQMGFHGSMKEFFEHLHSNKELMPFTEPEQVIDNLNTIHERMKPALARLFDKTPKTPFEVRREVSFREATGQVNYLPGSIDGSRTAILYIPIPNVEKYNIFSEENLFLHEAIPGHHYQLSLQQENTTLPEFRRTLVYEAYSEGWALYAESLGKELGLYSDPYQYFGMLTWDIHRAIRLVVDAGLHSQGWTREQAIQYFLEHEPLTEREVINEVEWYMASPGIVLSYKIGQLKILELRSKAEQELGGNFDVAQFHNQILETGCIPLNILEDKIIQWIESERARLN